MASPAEQLRTRLRADLLIRMRERQSFEAGVLRGLLALIDNAQAVQIDLVRPQTDQLCFGASGIEVARHELSATELNVLLRDEAQQRHDAARQFQALGQDEAASRASDEASMIARYLD